MMGLGTRRQRDLFKERLDEIRPMERYCRFELGDETDVVGLLMESQVCVHVCVCVCVYTWYLILCIFVYLCVCVCVFIRVT